MNAIHQFQIVVARPPVPVKPVRLSPPRLDQMHADAAIAAAVAKRDRQWSEAVRDAGGSVNP